MGPAAVHILSHLTSSSVTKSMCLSGGTLLIDDINGANTNDKLTTMRAGSNIRDSNASARGFAPGAHAPGSPIAPGPSKN